MKITPLLLPAALAVALSAPLSAQAADLKVSDALKTLSFSGDVRLRQDMADKTTLGQTDRARARFRLRLAVDAELPENLKVKTRFASGTGEQNATNQSFDNGSGGKQLWIDRAYVEWKPVPEVSLTGGKVANPLWTPLTADVVWDEDLNPEGFGQQLEAPVSEGLKLFANALQMAADEDANTTADQWEFSGQLGADATLGSVRWKSAVAYHHWTNTRNGTLGQTAIEGNRRILTGPSAGALSNDFGVTEFTTELQFPVRDTTLSPGATYAKNFAAKHQQQDGQRLGDTGYQLGARLGKAAAKKTWEAAYYYKWVEVDATPADFNDSDFGDGGTNRQGHVAWVAYNPREWLQLKAKTSFTRVINDSEPPGRDGVNRYQLDVSVKF